MFLLIWGWQTRYVQLGVLGPFACPHCSWLGTFWFRRHERRFRLYFIPITRWWTAQFACICRNCGSATYLRRREGEQYLGQLQPIGAPDPFGPAPAPVAPAAVGPAAGGPDLPEAEQAEWDTFAKGGEGSDVRS